MAETNSEARPRDASLPPLTYGKRRHYLDIIQHERDRMFNASRKTTIRRSDVEMYMDILAAIKASPRPTRIMYGCNMSWKPFQDRLEFLIRAGFVNAIVTGEDVDARSREALYLTPTGDDILSSWKKAMDMMYEALERVLKR